MMETAEVSDAAAEQVPADKDVLGVNSIKTETPIVEKEVASEIEASIPVDLEVNATEMEMDIEKIEVEPEEPILPDHYYDDGNIPVFKPVSSRLCSRVLTVS
jgi:hypothetical protein